MDNFTRELKASIGKALGQTLPWGDVNPLVVIGLTEAVLDLGLTEDQIYAVIKSYGRQLAAQVHPDRKPENVSPERQRQILGAFGILDSRDDFIKALAHFKTLRAEDRRETKILSQAIRAERKRVAGFESQAQAIKDAEQALNRERSEFLEMKEKEPALIPDLQLAITAQAKQIKDLNNSVKKGVESGNEWKKKFDSLAIYIANLGNSETNNELGMYAFSAKWVATVSLTWQIGHPQLSPIDPSGATRVDFAQAASNAGIKRKEIDQIIDGWNKAVRRYETEDKLNTYQLPLGISLVKLNSGKSDLIFGVEKAVVGRIMGSIPETSDFQFSRAQLRTSINIWSVMEKFCPFLVPGGVLVSIFMDRYRRASWSLQCPAFRFSTKKIILAAG